MTKRYTYYLYMFLLICSGTACMALAPVDRTTSNIYARAGKIVSGEMPYKHLNHLSFNNAIATNAMESFLNALDYDHSFFLASDVERFRKEAPSLDEQVKRGNLSFAFDVYSVLLDRISNRVDYVSTLLTNGFDVTIDESYQWRRKDQPWPADETAWDELWRKKIKNQYVSKLVAETLAEEKAAETNTPSQSLELPAVETNELADIVVVDVPVADAEKLELIPPESTNTLGSTTNTPFQKLTPAESIIKEYSRYLDTFNDNDAHWLLSLYISSFVRAYDPHSDYMSQNNTEDFDISMKLSLVGIGALLSSEDGAAKVVRLIPGGPAEQDGRLQPGDKIIAVGQGNEEPVDIMHWPLSKSVRLIRGEKNTTVALHVIPASDFSGSTVKVIDIVRDEVKLEERAAKGHIKQLTTPETSNTSTVAVIEVPDFYADINNSSDSNARSLTRDVRQIINDLSASNHLDGMVLDLRNNGGGSLPEAIDLTGLFIASGPVVQVKNDYAIINLADTDPDIAYDGPLVVLVNRQSASASEIFAGALQDYGRALIVGDSKTHGKGTVQSLIPLRTYNPTLGSLKLTSASYYRIAGGSTQKKGVIPDIIIPSILDSMEIGEEYLPGALEWSMVDPAFYQEDPTIGAVIPTIRAQSELRRLDSERFQKYSKLLDYLAGQRKSDSISLQLEERLPMARKEAEMADFIVEYSPDGKEEAPPADEETSDDDAENSKAPDLILDETLNILLDLIEQTSPSIPPANGAQPHAA